MSEQSVLVCRRIADQPEPPVKSKAARCDQCGARVWVALSSPTDADVCWCVQCTIPAIALDPNVEARGLSLEQVADIEAYRKRHAQ